MSASDLLSALEPSPEEIARPVGMIAGPVEGLAAGLAVWCGPSIGWRDLGSQVGAGASVLRHRGRLRAVLAFDMGPAPKIVAADSVDGADQP